MKKKLFDHQQQFLDEMVDRPDPVRACLYFKTGSGKSLTAVLGMKRLGYDRVLVIAPPSTHKTWEALCRSEGIEVRTMSHAKFRRPDTKVDRFTPIIADEFHMFGGHYGKGWKKIEALARRLEAAMFLLSATPNYNDAERCYCIHRVLSPHATKGGYLQWLYENCVTKQNPFSMTPDVVRFRDYPDAAAFLADLPGVWYLEDDLQYNIEDIEYDEHLPAALTDLRYNAREHRMVASEMEMRHTSRFQGLVDSDGLIALDVMDLLKTKINEAVGSVLVYANHATVAEALARTLEEDEIDHYLVTGRTTPKQKDLTIDAFRAQGGLLVGTASLATGTDGLDKVCDTLIILDDTDDDALRRQLVGRIMPRGPSTSSSHGKRVLRFVPV